MITVTGRHLTMSGNDRFIGFEKDHNAKTIEILIKDESIAALHFKIDIENPACTVTPQKVMRDDGSAVLTWVIGNGITQNSGSLKMQLRGFDDNESVVWHSESAEFYIGQSIDVQTQYSDEEMSDFEKIEQAISVMYDETAENTRQAEQSELNAKKHADDSQNSCNQAEIWANNAKNDVNSAISIATEARAIAENAESMSNQAKNQAEQISQNITELERVIESKSSKDHTHDLAQSSSSSDLSVYEVTAYDNAESEAYVGHASKVSDNEYSFSWYSWDTELFGAGDIISLTFESVGGNFWCGQAGIELSDSGVAVIEGLVLTEPLRISGSFGGVKIRVDSLISGGDGFMSASDKNKLGKIESIEEISNTALSIAKNAVQAKGFENYQALISELNTAASDTYIIGQNFFIKTHGVPDLWVYAVEFTPVTYTYVDDEAIVNELESTNLIKIGHYVLSTQEGPKVDLSNVITTEDYASDTKAGIVRVKTPSTSGLFVNSTGDIMAYEAENPWIDKKRGNGVINPSNLDYAVKKALSDSKLQGDVANAWTDEEKASARELLGISNLYILTEQDKKDIADIVAQELTNA